MAKVYAQTRVTLDKVIMELDADEAYRLKEVLARATSLFSIYSRLCDILEGRDATEK